MPKKRSLHIILIFVILHGVLLIPNVHSEDSDVEWTENITKNGICGTENVRTHIQVNRTVVSITVNLSWVTENGNANLDMWIEGVDGFIVDASYSTQMPEIMFITKFPNRGRWTIVITQTTCGSCGIADYNMDITLRNVKLPELDIAPQRIKVSEKVNLSISSPYENISRYFFDFGDDTQSGWITQPSIIKKYNASGEYKPRAKVRYSDGTESDWVDVGSIEVRAEKENNIFLWILIWLMILMALIFLVTLLHGRKKSD